MCVCVCLFVCVCARACLYKYTRVHSVCVCLHSYTHGCKCGLKDEDMCGKNRKLLIVGSSMQRTTFYDFVVLFGAKHIIDVTLKLHGNMRFTVCFRASGLPGGGGGGDEERVGRKALRGSDGRQGNIGLVKESSSSQEASSRTLHQGLVQEGRSANGRRVGEEAGGGGGGGGGGAREAETVDLISADVSIHMARKTRENEMRRLAGQQGESQKWWTVVSGGEGEGGECSERSVGDVVAGEGVLHGLYSQKPCI